MIPPAYAWVEGLPWGGYYAADFHLWEREVWPEFAGRTFLDGSPLPDPPPRSDEDR